MVVGGGPAGMNAALAAAATGHEVTLYEKSMKLGGQLHLAGSSPGREEFLVLIDDLIRELTHSRVKIELNSEVDGKLLLRQKPEHLILATGGKPITPAIQGAAMEHVIQAWEVLQGKWLAGQDIVVIGGGAVGVETALLVAQQGTLSGEELKFLLLHEAESLDELQRLALEGSKKVTLIELQDRLGTNFGKTTRWSMLQDIGRHGVSVKMEATVRSIEKEGVVIEHSGEEQFIKADTVILAVGTLSHNPLETIAAELGISTTVVGDALQPATVMEATHQGFKAGNGIA
jgi:2,4-dienoyl-CoA reductase (NADPH2)